MNKPVVLCLAVLALSAFEAIPAVFVGGSIKIVAISGEGSLNNIAKKRAQSPRIKVVDQNDTPVSGAEVIFTLPPTGPSGAFASGKREFRTRTDEQGEASSESFRPNDIEGRFFITVTVIHEEITASYRIPQTNTTAGGILE